MTKSEKQVIQPFFSIKDQINLKRKMYTLHIDVLHKVLKCSKYENSQ